MAKQKKYYYECVYPCDVPWYGPDQRRERWVQKGKMLVQPPRVLHSVRCFPSRGYNARGEKLLGDYIATNRPIGKAFTEEVTKSVSRVDWNARLRDGGSPRKMVEKSSKVKFVLLEPDEVTDAVRRVAYDFEDDWGAALFNDADTDVVLPAEAAEMARQGARELNVKEK